MKELMWIIDKDYITQNKFVVCYAMHFPKQSPEHKKHCFPLPIRFPMEMSQEGEEG